MIENLENEQWLPIEGYEDYEVSNYGRVKSLERINSLGRTVKERILKPSTNEGGYKQVKLCNGGKEKTFKVHRLVAMAFIPNSNSLPQVNHMDENPSNNHVDNLEWCTAKYNNNYGTRKEKASKAMSGDNNPKPMLGKLGKEHPNAKQVIQLTLDNQVVKFWDSAMDVERELSFYHGNISACCKGRLKHAYKYKWAYA